MRPSTCPYVIAMKTIVNKTRRPLKIKLSQGAGPCVWAPPRKGQISTQDAERESVKQIVEAGEIEILDDPSPGASQGEPGTSAGMAKSQDHHPAVFRLETRRPLVSEKPMTRRAHQGTDPRDSDGRSDTMNL